MEYAKLQHKCCLKIWSFRQMNKSQHKLRTRWKSAQKMWRCMNPKNKTWSIWLQILIRMLQNFLLSHEIYFWFYICNQIMRNTRKTGDWFENSSWLSYFAVHIFWIQCADRSMTLCYRNTYTYAILHKEWSHFWIKLF